MRTAVLIVLLAVGSTTAAAQKLESHKLGGTTYYSGKSSDGAAVAGTSRKLGNTTYSEFRSGGSQTHCTTRTLGSRTYTECRP